MARTEKDVAGQVPVDGGGSCWERAAVTIGANLSPRQPDHVIAAASPFCISVSDKHASVDSDECSRCQQLKAGRFALSRHLATCKRVMVVPIILERRSLYLRHPAVSMCLA